MSNGQLTVERPFRGGVNAAEFACAVAEGSGGDANLINLSTVECFSQPITKLTEGKLSDVETDKASLRVKIRPSVFIVETNKEYTMEEISTESLNKLIHKRVNVFRSSGSVNTEPPNKERRICRDIQEGKRVVIDHTASSLETLSSLLPVVINVAGQDWTIRDSAAIQIDLKGNKGVEELVSLVHVDADSEWEQDRLTALMLNSVQGVYYARHGVLDVVVTSSTVSGRTLTNPVIFRVRDFKLWINTPLQLAFPSVDSDTTAENTSKILYRHPSLNSLRDLKDMARRSKSVSSLIIPGVSKFNTSELEVVTRGGGKLHYFTAQCIFSKKDVTLEDLMSLQHDKDLAQQPSQIATVAITTTGPPNMTTAVTATDERKKKEAEAITNAFGPNLDELSTALSSEYIDRHHYRDQHQQTTTASSSGARTPTSKPTPEASIDTSVTCFFGPNYKSIVECLTTNDNLNMHILPTSLDSASSNRVLVATRDGGVMEIHNSGRFLDLTHQSAVFVPDLSIDTLKTMLRGTGNAAYTGAMVASTVFYNNVNLTTDGGAVSASGSTNLADIIVEFFPGFSARVVSEVAGAIASVYHIDDSYNILFPSLSIMAERMSYNRSYRWSDPITCVVGLYQKTMDTLMKKIRRGDTVSLINADWTNMHINVLQVVLEPFFDAVLKSGAWVITEVRQFLRSIVEDTLLKYTATTDHLIALGFNQATLDIVTRLVVHWAVIQSAAENEGVCKAFPRDSPFIVEPGVSLKNFTLSDTPGLLLKGDNLADKLRDAITTTPARTSYSVGISKHARSVSLSVPSARFLKSDKDFTVLITVPDKDDDDEDAIISIENSSSPAPFTVFIDYSPPKLLQANLRYSSEFGFGQLKDKGVLTGKYQVTQETKLRQGSSTNNKDSEGAHSSNNEEVEGVKTGFTIDGKIEHISVFLPGSMTKSTGPPELPVNSTKQSKYIIRDMGMETVFFEPMLSSLTLYNAAKEKRVNVKSSRFFEECLSPLIRGRIDIFPKKGGIDSAASEGFNWLWKVLQANKGFTTNINKLMYRMVEPKNISTSTKNTISSVVSNSWSGVQSQLLAACDQLKTNQNTPGGGARGGGVKSLFPGSGNKAENKQQATATTPIKYPAFEPTFFDIQTFLTKHLRNVITTLIARMMMVVSNAELKIIKTVADNVSKTMLDSYYVAIEPERATQDIMERIMSEQNGIVVDVDGGVLGSEATRYATTGSIFITNATTASSTSVENAPLPPHFEAIVSRLQSLGAEQQPPPPVTTTRTPTTKTMPTTTNTTASTPTRQEIINHNEQMKKIRDASMLTSRLLLLIRDDGKKERVEGAITEAVTKYKRTPSYFTASKPSQPIFKGQSSNIPSTSKPTDFNFSSAQDLYIPVNPRHLLTDMQWIESLSIIESATRDSIHVSNHFKQQANETAKKLERLLNSWKRVVTSVTDENISSTLSSLRVEWFNREASRIAAIREQAERSRIALAVQGKIVNLDSLSMVAVARSLIDIDYYVRIPNFWTNRDWKRLIYTATAMATIPLRANISRGMMAASQSTILFESTFALSSAEETIRNV